MSVVTMVIKDDYALIMGDTKLSNNPDRDVCHKVFKKDNILLGFTGSLRDVGIYLYPIFTPEYIIDNNYTWGKPMDFFSFLDKKFYNAVFDNKHYDARIVVASKFGDKYISKYYCLSNFGENDWKNDTQISFNGASYFYLGARSHGDYFDAYFKNNISRKKEDLISHFQKTLDYGVVQDITINNRMEWFSI